MKLSAYLRLVWSPVKVNVIVVMCSSCTSNLCRSLVRQSTILIDGNPRNLFRNLNIIPGI